MLATPFLTVPFLLTTVHAIGVTISRTSHCRGLSTIRSFYVISEDGCFIRGDYGNPMELELNGGEPELAIAASIYDEESQSEYIAFFSSNDCNPDNLINDTFLERGCRDEKAKDYQSWAVWDTCEEEGCSLGV